MRLVEDKTNREIEIGSIITDFRGAKAVVTGWQEPAHPSSTGSVYVDRGTGYFPSVFNLHWEG